VNRTSVDLLVGGSLGPWAIDRADPAEVAQVVTDDRALASLARSRGFSVCDGDDWQPSARGLSVHYQRIVPDAMLEGYEGLWNLHPGFLPWGRGFYPVFWALWEGSPAGATLHEITSQLDAGPIVEQLEVPVLAQDTGGSLHARVQAAERALFERWWPRLLAGEAVASTAQPADAAGSTHTRGEFLELKRDGWRALSPAELERLQRCLDFPGYDPIDR
jgi:methionyl-tRNA formyltransferase